MKRIKILILAALLMASAAMSLPVGAAGDTDVSAAGAGLFSSNAQLYGVSLRGSIFGGGAIIGSNGTAEGEFQTVLSGTTLTGQPQDIALEGTVTSGTLNPSGSVTFGGTGTVDTGAGVLAGVPFSVTITTSGLQFVIGATTLPTQSLTEGGITISGYAPAAPIPTPSPTAAQTVGLGTAANFAVLAGTAVTCTGATVTGNVGVFPGTVITQTSCPVTGTISAADTVAAPAQSDFVIAYNKIAALTCDQALTGLGSQTLSPGVYCFDAAATQTGGVLTLVGPADGVWIFKIGVLGTGALTGTNFSVLMTGGGQASNVYWRVAQATTMTDSTFLGTILSGAGITMTRGTFDGRALANAAVTITGTAVTGFGGAAN